MCVCVCISLAVHLSHTQNEANRNQILKIYLPLPLGLKLGGRYLSRKLLSARSFLWQSCSPHWPVGKARARQGRGKAFERRQKIVGFIFVSKASKIDFYRLILLPEAVLRDVGWEEAGGRGQDREDWPAVGGEGRARQTHGTADVSGLAGLVVFISPTPGCSQTPGQIWQNLTSLCDGIWKKFPADPGTV